MYESSGFCNRRSIADVTVCPANLPYFFCCAASCASFFASASNQSVGLDMGTRLEELYSQGPQMLESCFLELATGPPHLAHTDGWFPYKRSSSFERGV
jgi:hypothetical protein